MAHHTTQAAQAGMTSEQIKAGCLNFAAALGYPGLGVPNGPSIPSGESAWRQTVNGVQQAGELGRLLETLWPMVQDQLIAGTASQSSQQGGTKPSI